MTALRISGSLIFSLLLLSLPGAAAAQAVQLPFDQPVAAGGVEAACTGIGSTAREDPRWTAFPLKVEVAGIAGQYLGDVQLTLSRADGSAVATVRCAGPWVLFRVEPGAYTVAGTADSAAAEGRVNVTAEGQARLILRFPELGGAVSPEHTPSPD